MITPEMRSALGIESHPNSFRVRAEDIIRFADSVEDGNPLFSDETQARAARYGSLIAPPTFLRSCYPGPPRVRVELPYGASVDGGSEWEYFEPVRPGDTITVTSKLVDFVEKQGRLGKMLLAIRELKYVNQFGSVVCLERNTAVLYNPPDGPSGMRVWGVEDEEWTAPGRLPGQLYFEDVAEGDHIPVLRKAPTTRQLVKYAAASVEYPEIHYDLRAAEAAGLPDVIVQGSLKHAFLAQLLTDWIGERGTLKRLNVQYRGMDVPGGPVCCKGVVTRKYVEEDARLVECEVWLENADGFRTTPGTALVSLPSRARPPSA